MWWIPCTHDTSLVCTWYSLLYVCGMYACPQNTRDHWKRIRKHSHASIVLCVFLPVYKIAVMIDISGSRMMNFLDAWKLYICEHALQSERSGALLSALSWSNDLWLNDSCKSGLMIKEATKIRHKDAKAPAKLLVTLFSEQLSGVSLLTYRAAWCSPGHGRDWDRAAWWWSVGSAHKCWWPTGLGCPN